MLTHTLRDQLDAWNSALDATCGSFRACLNPELPLFIGDINHQQDDPFAISMIRTNAGQIYHRRRSSDQRDERWCFLVMQRSGRARMLYPGQYAFDLYPGEMMLMDSIVPCDIVPHGLLDHVSIHLDRNALQRLLPGRCLFGKVPACNISGQLLHGMVKQLLHSDASLSADEGQAMQEVMVLLLSQALRQDSHANAPGNEMGHKSLQRLAHQLIEQQLDNPLLSPPSLAQQLGMSLRQLYRLFDEEGGVSRHIQQRRLMRSAEELRNRQLGHESITQIAYRCGFTDSAHFSRAFKKHFSCTPSEYRAGSCPPETPGYGKTYP